MVSYEEIRLLSDQIVQQFHPEKIILFGSYAYGKPVLSSDVDLLIVMPYDLHPAYQAAAIRASLKPPFPVDLIVRDPAELAQRIALGDWFLRDIMQHGQVLYASSHG
ncbi:MAG: nucleotidyltransferase domain-containing protein [Candidatus Viridilinea halotolerans]|uniref:Nucleotidyltransferase domain-containing protein n=1 Tax=Candidatus Viridilinea halotolerans TaxID=2491704 RepID=A0A426TTF1_9CHLR|nr:MAG: nucleotidyltransferase domain-containing protein [Candidatus Viridilinea halotolerans]